jgi:hypothetical protein
MSETFFSQNIQAKSLDDILQDILDKNYPESPTKAIFERFLNAVMLSLDCNKPKKNQSLLDFNCGPDIVKNTGVHLNLKHFLTETKLNALFDFFSNYIIANKNTLSDDNIKKSILLGTHYTTLYEAKIIDPRSTFSEDDILTTSSFLKFLTSLFNIHNITKFETPGLIHKKGENLFPNITWGDPQKIDMLVGHSIKLIQDLIARSDFNRYIHQEESFLGFLENLGDLGFQLKLKEEFEFQAQQIQSIAQTIFSSTGSENLSDTFKKSAAWAFLDRYHDKNVNDIESDCSNLFGFENCLPPDNENTRLIYNKINTDNIGPTDLNTVNYQLVVDKLSQGSENNVRNQLLSLSNTNKLTHFINFFKDYLKQNNTTLDETYLKKTFKLCHAITEIATSNKTSLRNTDNKLDIKYFKLIQAQIALVLNLVKSNSKENLLLDQTHIISQLKNLVIDVIENYQANKYSNQTDEYIVNIPKSYLDIINYCKDSESTLIQAYNLFATSINEVAKACLSLEVCNTTQIKKQSFEILGGMTRKLERAHRIHLAKEVINSAKELKGIVERSGNISNTELGNDVTNFLKIRHSRNQVLMDKDCKDLFDLSPQDCRPFTPSNTTTSSTTLTPFAVNSTTVGPAINQTSSFEETSTIYPDSISELPTTTEVGATAGHAVGEGLINILIQIISNWLRNKGYGESKISAISLSLAGGLLQASYSATYPLMLLKLQEAAAQGDEDNAQAQWEMIIQQMYPNFLLSLGLSTTFQLLNYLSKNYLSKQSMLKSLIQSFPTLSSLWTFSQNPILGTLRSATVYGISAAGLFGFNRYYGTRNRQPLDLTAANENKNFEMQALNEEETESKKIDLNTVVNSEKDLTPEEIFFKKVEFTTPDQFKKLKEYLSTIILSIKNLQDNLSDQTHIDRLEQILDIPAYQLGLRYDLIDLENFPNKFIMEYNKCQNEKERSLIVKNNFDYFKTMIKTMYDKLLSDNVNNDCLNYILCSIKETKTLKSSITDLIKRIEDNLSFIRGITKPIVSIHLNQAQPLTGPENLITNGRTTILRQNTKRVIHANNRHTFHASDSDTRFSSASEEDSVISTGSSKDEENALIIRPLLKS